MIYNKSDFCKDCGIRERVRFLSGKRDSYCLSCSNLRKSTSARRLYHHVDESCMCSKCSGYRRHKEAGFPRASARRAREKGLFVESVNRKVVFERDNGVCGICRSPVDPNDFHLDHVIPLSLGGPHEYENVQLSHPTCNWRKAKKVHTL